MAIGIEKAGVDLTAILAPYDSSMTKAASTGIEAAGGDLNNTFAPLSYGVAPPATGIKAYSTGNDLNTIFAGVGTLRVGGIAGAVEMGGTSAGNEYPFYAQKVGGSGAVSYSWSISAKVGTGTITIESGAGTDTITIGAGSTTSLSWNTNCDLTVGSNVIYLTLPCTYSYTPAADPNPPIPIGSGIFTGVGTNSYTVSASASPTNFTKFAWTLTDVNGSVGAAASISGAASSNIIDVALTVPTDGICAVSAQCQLLTSDGYIDFVSCGWVVTY